LFDWQKWKFHRNDYWIDSYLDRVPRIDYRQVSKKEFIEKYESKNVPVVITHVTDQWKANKHWTEEVCKKKSLF
jgi:histone arginine demethylase JMJD6